MNAQIPAVEMRGIVKRFPGVIANDHVDLIVNAGQIHALLGENGAGKSTLMKVLVGLYRPDAGEVRLHGQPADVRSPRDATQVGIGMVHQHFMLVEPQTVAENVILGLDSPRFRLDMASAEEEIRQLSVRYGLQVDPGAYIWQLSVGEQQRVEILKMLYRGADILILDEPTAVLTPQESEELGRTLRQMADEGKAVIFITHKLDEVIAFSDRVTVLRRGRTVANLVTAETNKRELARQMVGREVIFWIDRSDHEVKEDALEAARPMLAIQNLSALNDKGLPALEDISFTVHQHEILGVAGVAGNGQRELVEVITGLRAATGGQVLLGGHEITNKHPRRAIDLGLSHVPEDRMHTGLIANMTVTDNLILKDYRHPPLARLGFLIQGAMQRFADHLINEFEIATPSRDTLIKSLSGGNLQKAILARELSRPVKLLIAAQPTRGLDVGSIEFIHSEIVKMRDQGAAVLLVSTELDEIKALSDRIAVMYEGRIMGIVPAQDADVEEIGLMMAGTALEKQEADLHRGTLI